MSLLSRTLLTSKQSLKTTECRKYCTVITTACPFTEAKPYSEVPGPTPLPLFGNTWRLLPMIGQYDISDFGKLTQEFHDNYGKICKFSKLVGRPDLLFVFDADEIERIYRQEGDTPYRPSVPCLVKYKSVVRKDFFGDLPGVVGVHGEPWRKFRTKVQKPVLQLQTVRKYIEPIENVTDYFIQRMLDMKDENDEMPNDFDNEIHKWSLEFSGTSYYYFMQQIQNAHLEYDSDTLAAL